MSPVIHAYEQLFQVVLFGANTNSGCRADEVGTVPIHEDNAPGPAAPTRRQDSCIAAEASLGFPDRAGIRGPSGARRRGWPPTGHSRG